MANNTELDESRRHDDERYVAVPIPRMSVSDHRISKRKLFTVGILANRTAQVVALGAVFLVVVVLFALIVTNLS